MASWFRPLKVVTTLLLYLEWTRAQTVGRKGRERASRERSWTKSVVWLPARVRGERAQVLARHREVGVMAGGAILEQSGSWGRMARVR